MDNKGFILNEESYETLKNTMNELYNNKNILLKNAFMVKSYIDTLVRIQSCRVYDNKVNSKDINTIEKGDILKGKKNLLIKI